MKIMFKISIIEFKLPSEIIIGSKDNEKVNQLETGKNGRKVFTKSINENLLGTAEEHKKNIKKNIDNKVFGSNKKSTIKKKGFDKYGYETGETYNNLYIKVKYKTTTI